MLKTTYFPGPEAGNYSASGPAPKKWDPNNFNKIPYVVPVPDFTKSDSQMWLSAYTGRIPGGEVKDGVVVVTDNAVITQPGMKTGLTTGNLIMWGAIAAGAYFLLRKKR